MNWYRGISKLLLGILVLIGTSNVPAAIDWNHTLIFGEPESSDYINLSGRDFSSLLSSASTFTSDSASSVSVSIVDGQLARNFPEGVAYYFNVSDFVIKNSRGYTLYSTGVSGELIDITFTIHGLMAGSYKQVFDGFADGDFHNATIRAVPLPSVAWLFGTALVGFVIITARCSV
jgi:hypothetical protein